MSECCLSTHPDFCKFWSIFDREDKISAFFICQIVSSCASIWNPVCTFRWLHLTITAVPCSFPSWRFGDMTHHQFKPVSLPAFLPLTFSLLFSPISLPSIWLVSRLGWLIWELLWHTVSPGQNKAWRMPTHFSFQTGLSLLWAHRRTVCGHITVCLSLDRLVLCLLQRIEHMFSSKSTGIIFFILTIPEMSSMCTNFNIRLFVILAKLYLIFV